MVIKEVTPCKHSRQWYNRIIINTTFAQLHREMDYASMPLKAILNAYYGEEYDA
jgi:hypothetical protein